MEPASCLHSLLSPPRSTAIAFRLRSSPILPKVYTRTKRYCSFIQYVINHSVNLLSYHGLYLITCLITSYSIWSHVGLFGHSAVVFHVFMFFFVFLCFTDCLCGCVFFSDISLIYSAVLLPVCLINLVTYSKSSETAYFDRLQLTSCRWFAVTTS